MRLAITIMVIALVAAAACTCFAGVNQSVKVAVHVRAHNAKLGCDYGTIASCSDIVTTEPSSSVDAFPVFYNLDEFLGVEYGITWPSEWGSALFTNCSDLVIDSVLNPGDGAGHTWFSCQAAAVAVPSFVWLCASGPGQICLTGYPRSGVINVLDCSEGLDDPVPCNYCAGVYGGTGDDPCTSCMPATEASTWGGVKQIFR